MVAASGKEGETDEIMNKKTVVVKKDSSGSRKRPADDDSEFSEWAKQLLTRPVPQIPIPNSDSRRKSKPATVIEGLSFDFESAIEKFTWHTIGEDIYLPCLYRKGTKYCCIRMMEQSAMGTLLHSLPQNVYDYAKLPSRLATRVEAMLLTNINSWHCDNFFGPTPFSEKDLMVAVTDIEEFYSYLTFAHSVLTNNGQNVDKDFSRCGFARMTSQNLVPYTILHGDNDGEKGVPLFYFEGNVAALSKNIKELSGWDLSYLKLCCKLHGVKKKLIEGDELKIVTISDLKARVSKSTTFTEQCWLPPNNRGVDLTPSNP